MLGSSRSLATLLNPSGCRKPKHSQKPQIRDDDDDEQVSVGRLISLGDFATAYKPSSSSSSLVRLDDEPQCFAARDLSSRRMIIIVDDCPWLPSSYLISHSLRESADSAAAAGTTSVCG